MFDIGLLLEESKQQGLMYHQTQGHEEMIPHIVYFWKEMELISGDFYSELDVINHDYSKYTISGSTLSFEILRNP